MREDELTKYEGKKSMTTTGTIPKNRILQAKDASNFRAALKLYETKQYKKALKGVEGVLKKNQDHGESLALKGLVLYHLGKKEEGHDFIKKALERDGTSYVCWHIYGLYNRQEKNYEEATKCYAKALQFDPENQNVLRDLGVLQMQVRQYEPLVVTKRKMLTDKPGFRQNWTGLAIAQHLSGDYAGAEKTLRNFEGILKEPLPKMDIENSELMLYKNLIIYESGDVQRALDDLEEIADKVLDVKSVCEARAKYLLELGRVKDAEREYRMLIKRNPECRVYYQQLEAALGVKEDDITLRLVLYDRLADKYPKADLPRLIPLEFLTVGSGNGEFKKRVASYIENYLIRQVPSTFVIVKPLYKDLRKQQIIDEFILAFVESARVKSANSVVSNGAALNGAVENGKEKEKDEIKKDETLLWSLYYLAQHYAHLSEFELALKTIDETISLSPLILELYMTKAHILKQAGDVQSAANVMDEARKMDISDRFINTKAAKYLLRADKIDDAVTTISLFTKNDSSGKGIQDMHDMQGLWFLTEQADSYARLGNDGLALKRYHAVFFIYEDAKNDQFDFHFYCPRRGTIRAYLNMVEWAESVSGCVPYQRAAVGAVKLYLKLDINNKRREAGEAPEEDEFFGLDEAEKKKAIKKAKKEKAKELKKEYEEKEKSESTDTDLFGKQLLATANPLQEAFKIWKPLSESKLSNTLFQTWQLGFEIYLAQKKYVLAVQALSKAKNTPDSRLSWVISSALRCRHILENDSTIPVPLKQVPNKILPTIVSIGDIIQDDANEFADKHIIQPNDSNSILDYVNTKISINEGGINSVKDIVEAKILQIPAQDKNLQNAIKGYEYLKSWRSSRLEEYRTNASKVWPRANAFAK